MIHQRATVRGMKEMISELEGIPSGQQRIVFQGRQLEERDTLQEHSISDQSVLHLVIRLRGGTSYPYNLSVLPPHNQTGVPLQQFLEITLTTQDSEPLQGFESHRRFLMEKIQQSLTITVHRLRTTVCSRTLGEASSAAAAVARGPQLLCWDKGELFGAQCVMHRRALPTVLREHILQYLILSPEEWESPVETHQALVALRLPPDLEIPPPPLGTGTGGDRARETKEGLGRPLYFTVTADLGYLNLHVRPPPSGWAANSHYRADLHLLPTVRVTQRMIDQYSRYPNENLMGMLRSLHFYTGSDTHSISRYSPQEDGWVNFVV